MNHIIEAREKTTAVFQERIDSINVEVSRILGEKAETKVRLTARLAVIGRKIEEAIADGHETTRAKFEREKNITGVELSQLEEKTDADIAPLNEERHELQRAATAARELIDKESVQALHEEARRRWRDHIEWLDSTLALLAEAGLAAPFRRADIEPFMIVPYADQKELYQRLQEWLYK